MSVLLSLDYAGDSLQRGGVNRRGRAAKVKAQEATRKLLEDHRRAISEQPQPYNPTGASKRQRTTSGTRKGQRTLHLEVDEVSNVTSDDNTSPQPYPQVDGGNRVEHHSDMEKEDPSHVSAVHRPQPSRPTMGGARSSRDNNERSRLDRAGPSQRKHRREDRELSRELGEVSEENELSGHRDAASEEPR